MSKNCAQIVRGQWAHGGSTIHRLYTKLWIQTAHRKLSPHISTATARFCTQIVHRPVDLVTRSKRQFSAQSTATTITTIT